MTIHGMVPIIPLSATPNPLVGLAGWVGPRDGHHLLKVRMVIIIHLLVALSLWVGPPTLYQPRRVATCTVVIFAQEGEGGTEILIKERAKRYSKVIDILISLH